MGQLCDDDCVAIFNKFDVKILKHNRVIITGLRDHTNGLWNIPLGTCPPAQQSPKRSHPNQANGILRHDITNREIAHTFTIQPIIHHGSNYGQVCAWWYHGEEFCLLGSDGSDLMMFEQGGVGYSGMFHRPLVRSRKPVIITWLCFKIFTSNLVKMVT